MPLIATLNLRHLARNGLPLEAAGVSLSAELTALVSARLALADPGTVDVLQWLAISERPHPLALLALAAGVPHERFIDAAEKASALGMATEAAADVFELAHGTLRTAILGDLSLTRQTMMHGRLASLLGGRPLVGSWPEVALHASRAGDTPTAVHATLRAAKIAIDRFAPGQAVHLIEHMLAETSRMSGQVEARLELLILGIEAAGWMLDTDRVETFAAEALALARQSRLPRHFARAVLAWVAEWQQGTFDAEAVDTVREAISGLDDADLVLRAHLYSNLSGMNAVSGLASGETKESQALTYAARALELASACDDPGAQRSAYQAKIVALWSTQGYEEQIDLAGRLAAVAGDSPAAMALGPRWSAIPRFCLGDVDGFRTDLAQVRHLAAQSGGRGLILAGYARQWDTMQALLSGDWALARQTASENHGGLTGNTNLELGALAQIMWVAAETGELDGLPDYVDHYADQHRGLTVLSVFAAQMWALGGDPDRARSRLKLLLDGNPVRLPRDITWTAMIAGLAEVAVLTSDRSLASRLVDALRPWHGTLVCVAGGLWSMGAAERSTALFHLALGHHETATQLLRRALARERRIGAPAVARRTAAWLARAEGGVPTALRDDIRRASHDGLLPLLPA